MWLPLVAGPSASSFSGCESIQSCVVNKRKLIRALAREAEVSPAEAADAVDELAHRLLQVMRRMKQPAVQTATCVAGKEKRQTASKANKKGAGDDQPR